MKNYLQAVSAFILLFASALPLHVFAGISTPGTGNQLYFTENKGQIHDQNGKPRPDIQFVLQSPGMTVFIGNGELHYQFSRAIYPGNFQPVPFYDAKGTNGIEKFDVASYRMDVVLAGASKDAVYSGSDWQTYSEHYYTAATGVQGAHARACNRIIYRNIYPGIDWILYIKDNKLEHEFSLSPGANPNTIKVEYKGASSLRLTADGSLMAATPMGTILEQAPVCYAGIKDVAAHFELTGNTLTYHVAPYTGALLIDPIVMWGTYYGPDASYVGMFGAACDSKANVYTTGRTTSATMGTIATTGSNQTVYGGGAYDAFIVKFDSTGHRLWATYYGGSEADETTSLMCDKAGGVYVAGSTNSASGIATAGSQQPVYNGNTDGFMAKFDTSGTLIWATYCGGSENDFILSVCCDTAGHVYGIGFTSSSDNIATPGAFRTGYLYNDPFLVKYDTAGNRIWGTYCGGEYNEAGIRGCTDGLNIYVVGGTGSDTGIASTGALQPALIPGSSSLAGFINKFDSSGARLWGTYYGGMGSHIYNATCDGNGALIVAGITDNDTGMTTPGCQQPVRAGLNDGFIAKMSPTGSRIWGTYSGGPGNDNAGKSIVTDADNNICLVSWTTSDTGMVTDGAWLTARAGDVDDYYAIYNDTGARVWSTYFGGSGYDVTHCVTYDGKSFYSCGITRSTENIATPGSFQPTSFPSTYAGFLVKFGYPDTTTTDTAVYAAPVDIMKPVMSVYPNPNTGTFSITGSIAAANGKLAVIVSDVSGRIVHTDEITVVQHKIYKQLSLPAEMPQGNYFLQLHTAQGIVTRQFVKK